jgi:hypothetical protein
MSSVPISSPTIAVLEDNLDRQNAMKAAVAHALPQATCIFFNSAHAMIDWLSDRLDRASMSPPSIISLDHDLDFLPGSDGRQIDPGDGRDVARFLATRQPCCPVTVHTSNSLGASSMMGNLQDSDWQVTRVYPESDVGWVKSHWVVCLSRLAYEWEELH